MQARGFILQASYRITSGVAVVHLYGRLESGETFLVRDHQQRPHFYVAAADAAKARTLISNELVPTEQRTFSGAQVCRIDAAAPADVPGVRDRLHADGIDTYEADVRYAVSFLIERDIKGGCEIEGEAIPGSPIAWTFDDPRLTPVDVDVRPSVLSFDIETDAQATKLLAISLYGCGADEVFIVDPAARPMPEKAIACDDERSAIDAFCKRVVELDPDVLTGWNVVDFDLSVLAKIAQRVRHPFELGREPGGLRMRPARGYFGSGSASIPGRLVLDGIDLIRGAFVRFDDYSLDAVAREVLGEGKALEGSAHDRVDEIMQRYAEDLPGFALYARTDARLALEI
ncbi:MAG TPA: 3'-5' exonuclease, partial [Pseudomonadales bacterium]|nr:3'-5' exonuclease [Pseudomonadales bacterium]